MCHAQDMCQRDFLMVSKDHACKSCKPNEEYAQPHHISCFVLSRPKWLSCKIILNSVLAGGARLDRSLSAVLKTPPKCSGEVPSSQAHCMPSREGSWSLSDGMLAGAGGAQRRCTSCATGLLAIHAL